MTQSPKLLIRDARPDERATIAELTLAAYTQYAEVMPRRGWEAYSRDFMQTINDRDNPAEFIVAEAGGNLVGSVLLYPAPAADSAEDSPDDSPPREGLPEVRLLAVAPAARGQGVGRALMQECLRRARRMVAPALGLHTTDLMQVAMRLYEQMGFERAPETDWSPAPNFVVKGYRRGLADIE
jgi:GNAT superfamily N-acetyltransferase